MQSALYHVEETSCYQLRHVRMQLSGSLPDMSMQALPDGAKRMKMMQYVLQAAAGVRSDSAQPVRSARITKQLAGEGHGGTLGEGCWRAQAPLQ
tara:strand:+ start:946 stop:1227 length:282 start_codon:yes stop_codon:yes gene_type:complete